MAAPLLLRCAAFAVLCAVVAAPPPPPPSPPLTVGVVRYSDGVHQIWADLQAALCQGSGVCFGVRLFDTYEELQDALFGGKVGIAWNGPVAHVRSEQRAREQGDRLVSLGMRDSDIDFEALIVSTTPAAPDGGVAGIVIGVVLLRMF